MLAASEAATCSSLHWTVHSLVDQVFLFTGLDYWTTGLKTCQDLSRGEPFA